MKYIAFLRAINVGGHTVKMEVLRELFEAIGMENVETYIASGNVLFESTLTAEKCQAQIEAHLHAALGYEAATFVRTSAEVTAIAKQPCMQNWGKNSGDGALNIAFLKQSLSKDANLALMQFKTEIDDFSVHGREIYWHCAVKQSDSTFSNARFEKTLKLQSTFRGANTVLKLAAKFQTA